MSASQDLAVPGGPPAPVPELALRGVAAGGPAQLARIGPNAIIQTAHALSAYGGRDLEGEVFARAGLSRYLAVLPEEMIPENEAIALFAALFDGECLPLQSANAIARDAGLRTGEYILSNRIPRPAQVLLKILPKPLAARALLSAIGKHSWTFAGSGRFSARYGRPLVIDIADNPLAFDRCAWHCAVFERLFGELVTSQARATCTRATTAGVETCRFEIAI